MQPDAMPSTEAINAALGSPYASQTDCMSGSGPCRSCSGILRSYSTRSSSNRPKADASRTCSTTGPVTSWLRSVFANGGRVEVCRARVVDHDRRGRLFGQHRERVGQRNPDARRRIQQREDVAVLRKIRAGAVSPRVTLAALGCESEFGAHALMGQLG